MLKQDSILNTVKLDKIIHAIEIGGQVNAFPKKIPDYGRYQITKPCFFHYL